MEIVSKASRMREVVRAGHAGHRRVALVPTMGALHDGHLSLVRRARELAEVVVVSIFVNPTQFGPNEDFTRYPRDLDGDQRVLSGLGVDYIFTPEVEEMYPEGSRTFVEVERWGEYLCGITRPGHFRGVTTVVAKLFNIVSPDFAVFGRKDAQQAILIERMARDLLFDVRIETCAIVREFDGLAMSSRNRYLSSEERQAALVLHRSLLCAKAMIDKGESNAVVIQRGMREIFRREPMARLDYIELVDPSTLCPVDAVRKDTLIAVAAHVGTTRLIDNWSVEAP
jgi:pantoate--beta-alanine ligase